MIRCEKKYSIEEVLSKRIPLKENGKPKRGVERKVDMDGDLINMDSQRYELFDVKGTKCVTCGIEGQYFLKEKHREDDPYHFNLYAVDDEGEEILMTKDHLIPRRKGGKNLLENYQPMCTLCNFEKGITTDLDESV